MRNSVIKKLLVISMAIIMMLAMTACSEKTALLGKWHITNVTAGNMQIDSSEMQDLGLSSTGYIKINKSGSCIVDLLGDEYEGTWEMNDDGEITIEYGKDEVGHAKKDGDVLNFTDSQGNLYELQK